MNVEKPEPGKGWALATKIAKVITFLVICGVVLAALAFGTCILMLAGK